MEQGSSDWIDVIVPNTAVEVKVTNIINLYFMRIQRSPIDKERRNSITQALQDEFHLMPKNGFESSYSPKVRDHVIIATNRLDSATDLPGWCCRGIVTDTSTISSDVFLLDDGITVNVPSDSLIKYSPRLLEFPPLSETVGMYNILPMSESRILKEWPKNTIGFAKELLQSAKKVYFQCLVMDKETKRQYGDFFLVIEDRNICLSKALIYAFLAVPFSDELLQAVKNPQDPGSSSIPYGLEEKKPLLDTKISTPSHDTHSNTVTRKVTKKKQSDEKIFIDSKFDVDALTHVPDARFTKFVHKALEYQGVNKPKQIQSYMWPAIVRGFSVIAIGSEKSGKTMGFTAPIVSSIAANEEALLKQKDEAVKPLALILCASVNKCMAVADQCKRLSEYHAEVKTFAAYNGVGDEKILVAYYNKIQILVTTPPFLSRLIEKKNFKDMDLSKLLYLVIHEADVLLSKYLEDLIKLIKTRILRNGGINILKSGSLQTILVARTWTHQIHSFKNVFMNDPFVCIGSFVEAAAFCQVRGKMVIRHTNQKNRQIADSLSDHLTQKTIIFCVDYKEATILDEFLKSRSIRTLLVHEQMAGETIEDVRVEWSRYLSGMYPVMICTDQVLSELNISDAGFLIHYSITSTSKSEFSRRFSVFMDNLQQTESRNKCKVMILFDETKESVHFKGVVDILKRLKVDLPTDWEIISNALELDHNLKIKNHPLCGSVKEIGFCETSACPYRHRVIAEVDIPELTSFSIGDELKLMNLHTHSASHFSARILGRISFDERTEKKKETPFTATQLWHLNTDMDKYFRNKKNHTTIPEIRVGMKCACKDVAQKFRRVEIMSIVERDPRTEKPSRVQVRNLEDGKIFPKISVRDLFELPDEFAKIQLPVVDVYIANLAPFDEECSWTGVANDKTQEWFKSNKGGDTTYILVKVLLHIGNSIWTDSVVSHTPCKGYKDLESTPLENDIIKHELGVRNEDHLPNLLRLCKDGGLIEVNGHSLFSDSESKEDSPVDECD
ncbi:hypothetical protein QAD02_015241 [Eretmocerus hayati]|uniref:Uncharacterized protein n=1 Tax=Eretmocerus hayati TaxID=131215 RepID=A0ACC2P846_9HYME|nr:hypothetical protein QAD02_015241 [Eretmocerus hayati]